MQTVGVREAQLQCCANQHSIRLTKFSPFKRQ